MPAYCVVSCPDRFQAIAKTGVFAALYNRKQREEKREKNNCIMSMPDACRVRGGGG